MAVHWQRFSRLLMVSHFTTSSAVCVLAPVLWCKCECPGMSPGRRVSYDPTVQTDY